MTDLLSELRRRGDDDASIHLQRTQSFPAIALFGKHGVEFLPFHRGFDTSLAIARVLVQRIPPLSIGEPSVSNCLSASPLARLPASFNTDWIESSVSKNVFFKGITIAERDKLGIALNDCCTHSPTSRPTYAISRA